VKEKVISEWSVAFQIPEKLQRKSDKIIGIAFDPANLYNMVLYGHTFLFHLDLLKHCWSLHDKYQPVLFCDFIAGMELLVVERPWHKVIQQLPPPMYRRRFAT